MSRRKGERKIVKTVRPYSPQHPVAHAISRGSRWFEAWVCQCVTPYSVLTRKTGIADVRLSELHFGAGPSAAEVEALAAVWYVPPEGLRASIDDCESRACQRRLAAAKRA